MAKNRFSSIKRQGFYSVYSEFYGDVIGGVTLRMDAKWTHDLGKPVKNDKNEQVSKIRIRPCFR